MLLFDIESDGLLDEITKVHCINAIDLETGQQYRFNSGVYEDTGLAAPRDGTLEDGLRMLAEAPRIAGHNAIGYDVPALRKVYPSWSPSGAVLDTKVLAQLVWPEVLVNDTIARKGGRLDDEFFTKGLAGSHKLAAWGRRMGFDKGDFNPADTGHTWATAPFSKEMDSYCMRDVEVTAKLMSRILEKDFGYSIELECRVAEIIFRQEQRGVCFNRTAAEALVAKLQARRAELHDQCEKLFHPWYVRDGKEVFRPKRDNRAQGYLAAVPLTKVKLRTFNPGSRDHISDRLIKLYGWEPEEFTPEGRPKVDETILGALPYEPAALLTEYLTVNKRLGQLSDGAQAWLNVVTDAERIHGRINTNGAVTGRMTHFSPNLAQVPRNSSPYGVECRSLFTVPPGFLMVGSDADGLELRMLGHFMARYDDGAFARAVVEGRKEDGTDAHSLNMKAAGLNSRDSAKTFIYALIYGAGELKLGLTVFLDFTSSQREAFLKKYPTRSEQEKGWKSLGKSRKARLMKNLPALQKLIDAAKAAASSRGWLKGLDGRQIQVRSAHRALNTLLQGAGAVVMKKALLLANDEIRARWPEEDVEFVLNVHDEFQAEAREEIAHDVGKIMADSIVRAGEFFGLRCPLAAGYDVGSSWAETH